MFFLYWLDEGFPAGPSEEHPNTRCAAFLTVDEAAEQAAHDLAAGATPVRLLDAKGEDVLDRPVVLKRACVLIDEHQAVLRGSVPARELKSRVAALKASAKKRS